MTFNNRNKTMSRINADESDNWRKRSQDPPVDSQMSNNNYQQYPNNKQYGYYDYGTDTYYDNKSNLNNYRQHSRNYGRVGNNYAKNNSNTNFTRTKFASTSINTHENYVENDDYDKDTQKNAAIKVVLPSSNMRRNYTENNSDNSYTQRNTAIKIVPPSANSYENYDKDNSFNNDVQKNSTIKVVLPPANVQVNKGNQTQSVEKSNTTEATKIVKDVESVKKTPSIKDREDEEKPAKIKDFESPIDKRSMEIFKSLQDEVPKIENNKPARNKWSRRTEIDRNKCLKETKTADTAKNWRSTAAPLPTSPPYCHPDDRNSRNRKEMFKPFLSTAQMEKEIKDGSLYHGIIRLTKSREDAYVTVDDLDSDIYIGGALKRNRSLHGDLVAVRLLDVDTEWDLKKERDAKRKKERMLRRGIEEDKVIEEEDQNDENKKVDNIKEEDDAKEDDIKDNDEEEIEEFKPAYCGEVVGILLHPPDISYSGFITIDRYSDPFRKGKLSFDSSFKLNFAWFKPNDKRVPFIKIRNEDIPKDLIENQEYYQTHLFAAGIRRWQITDTNPTGKIIKELGPIGDLFAERESIISENNVVAAKFSDIALRDLPELPWSIPNKEFDIRRDLRSNRIFSIDPVTAKDLDDALHINELEDGYFEVGVHIADVSYFLRKGSALDSEARSRGTSTYLVDSVIPMLPNVLCEELCSLNPDVDRLAFSVIWKMHPSGVPVDTWFGKTIIRSCAKLAYEDAQCVLDGNQLPNTAQLYDGHNIESITNDILLLNSIAKKRREKRYTDGSLSLNSVKLNFELNENGEPISVRKFESKEANRLIEEFMLCANISVAQKITASFPNESLLRRHEEPLERRLNDFLKTTDALGLEFDGQSAGSLQKSFDNIQNPQVKDVLLVLAIRCMQRAKYFCSGVADISKYGHYALNEALYTHFTSPIRRYADVVVHRLLEAAINEKDCGYEKKAIQNISFTCNSKKDGAKSAQEASINLYLSRYLSELELSKGPLYTSAEVISIGKEIYEIYVPVFGLEKKIYMEGLPTEQYAFDRKTQTLDIFWKQGVPVTMINEEKIYAQERIRKDDYSDEESEGDEMEEVDESLNALSLTNEIIPPPVILEPVTGLQRLKIFSSVDVRLQVNMDRSPPIINIYPVNPFSGETIVKLF